MRTVNSAFVGSNCGGCNNCSTSFSTFLTFGVSSKARLVVSNDSIPSETQRLSADHIAQSVQHSENRSLWLCGSRSFTNSIAGNLKTRLLHQELFELR